MQMARGTCLLALVFTLLPLGVLGEAGFFTTLVSNVKDLEGRVGQAVASNDADRAGAKMMSSDAGRADVRDLRQGKSLSAGGVGRVADATGRSKGAVVGILAKDKYIAVITGRTPPAEPSSSDGNNWAAKLDAGSLTVEQ